MSVKTFHLIPLPLSSDGPVVEYDHQRPIVRHFDITQAKDPNKIWHIVPERLLALDHGEILPPVSIEVQPTMGCNLRCPWCSYWQRNRFDEGGGEALPFELVEQLAQYCREYNVRGVYLSGGGEPCAYPRIKETVNVFREAGCQLAMVTNGTLFARKLLDVANAFTYLQVSLINPDRQEYQKLTGRDRREQMMALPSQIKARWSGDSPTIGAMYVLAEQNYRRAWDAITFARDAGFDYCAFRVALDFENRGVALPEEALLWLTRGLEEHSTDDEFTNLRAVLTGERDSPNQQGQQCMSAALGLYATVTARGEVFLCVPDVGKGGMAIGTLENQLFDEIWGGERHRQILQRLHHRYSCGMCHPACRAHAYNRVIAAGMPNRLPNLHLELV